MHMLENVLLDNLAFNFSLVCACISLLVSVMFGLRLCNLSVKNRTIKDVKSAYNLSTDSISRAPSWDVQNIIEQLMEFGGCETE
jgi:hypothetical protein